MPNASQIAAFVLFGLVLHGHAKANDFVITQSFTPSKLGTCWYTNQPGVTTIYCTSRAYVFNRDTSDVYICRADLTASVNWSRLSVQKFRVDKWGLCRG